MKKIALIVFLLAVMPAALGQEKGKISLVETAAFLEAVQQPEVQLIDVRTPEEFQEGHLEGARNMDFLQEDFMSHAVKLDKNKPVYLYCRSGKRSGNAAKELAAAGFLQIVDLQGGYLGVQEYEKEQEISEEDD